MIYSSETIAIPYMQPTLTCRFHTSQPRLTHHMNGDPEQAICNNQYVNQMVIDTEDAVYGQDFEMLRRNVQGSFNIGGADTGAELEAA